MVVSRIKMRGMLCAVVVFVSLLSVNVWSGEHVSGGPSSISHCFSHPDASFDHCIDEAFSPVANFIASVIFAEIPLSQDFGVKWVVLFLGFGALFFTIYLGGVNIWGFRHALDVVRGKYYDHSHPGEITHFQALSTALSGTVGLGNIAGVAVAISLGGPGATFWMILAGLLGMATKMAECTLGVKYRMYHANGSVSGGPKYYLTAGLAERGWPQLGRVLAVVFAVSCIGGAIGAGNMFQANQAMDMVIDTTGGSESFFANHRWVFGLVVALLVGLVIIGGIKSIARVTARLVPFMALVYVATAVLILLANASQIPGAFMAIIKGAFNPEGIMGGIVGVMIIGIQRAAFSNEAGFGSASIAHSAVKTNEPATEGFVALLEPFIDTVVICTMTALVIIITGVYTNTEGLDGVTLTASAFASVIPFFGGVLTLAVILFALSTMLSWSYYGSISWAYLFGHSKTADLSFKILFCCFIIVGATSSLNSVLLFSDSMVFAMCIPNIIGLYFLAPVVKEEIQGYWERKGN